MGITTVFKPQQKLPSRELNQGGTLTTAQQFVNSDVATIEIRPQPDKLVNAAFHVRAWGRVEGGTTTNFTIKLLHDTTVIEASSARAVNSAKRNFFIEVICVWDKDSDRIEGFGRSAVANLFDAEAALDNVVTPDFETNVTVGFNVTGTFSTGNVGNKAFLDGFEVEVL